MTKQNRSFTAVLCVVGALLGAGFESPARAAIVVANSVADFYTTAQPTNNWYYLAQTSSISFANRNSGSQMVFINGQFLNVGGTTPHWQTQNGVAIYTSIWADGAHPGLGGEKAVRRWVSEVTDPIAITGTLSRTAFNPTFGNGVSLGVFVNGTLLDANGVAAGSYVNVASGASSSFSLSEIPVTTGDLVDFVLFDSFDGAMSGLLDSDAAGFSVLITVPEPASMALLALGTTLLLARRKRA